VPCQGFDRVRGDPGFFGSPFRGLHDAVHLAEHVVFDLVHSNRVGGDVLFVVCSLGDPHVDDRQLEGRIGIREDRYPLVGVDGRGVIEIRTDVNLLHARFLPEEHQTARELSAEAPWGRFKVAALDNEQFGIFRHIVDKIFGGRHIADEALAPHMFGAPVPAFPTVGVSDLLGKTAHLVEEQRAAAMRCMDQLAFGVAVALKQDRRGAVKFVLTLDFGRYEIRGLVPGNALELA